MRYVLVFCHARLNSHTVIILFINQNHINSIIIVSASAASRPLNGYGNGLFVKL